MCFLLNSLESLCPHCECFVFALSRFNINSTDVTGVEFGSKDTETGFVWFVLALSQLYNDLTNQWYVCVCCVDVCVVDL